MKIVYPNEYFVVCTVACKEGLGGVLNQNGFVIGFESRKLKEHERLYATHDLELHELHTTTISMYQTDIKGRIYKAAKVDLQYMELVTKLQQGTMQ
jgi:hypothetical protein